MFNSSQEIIKKQTKGGEDNKKDYLLRENSNFINSLPLLRHNIDNHEEEKYLMENIFTKELVNLYDRGVVYIHDKKLAPYCNSLSCMNIASIGVPTTAKNMIASAPTKKINTFFRQMSNAVVLISQQSSGAIMLSQLTTVLAGYLYYREEKMNDLVSEKELYEQFYNLIWELNLPLRSGSQSSFSNITMEFGKPSEEVANEYIVVGGDILMEKYKDIPCKYFNKINKAFIDAMSKGSGQGIPFTFPLITISITDDFKHSDETYLYLLDKMYSWGGCYFENFTTEAFDNEIYKSKNPLIKPRDPEVSRSLCCRLNIDLSLLSKLGGGLFGSSTGNTGAVQVLNLNLNRILMEYKFELGSDFELLKNRISEVMEIMEENHQRKREWILDNKQLYPTFFAYNEDLKNYFNVFAVSAMNEGLINIGFKGGMKDEAGKVFAHKVMQHIHTEIDKFILRDNVACGVEFAPNENAGVKLARHDLEYGLSFGEEIFVQGDIKTGEVYTTSGCMLPFAEEDFIEQIENASEFQSYGTSGSILHQFLEEKLEPSKIADSIKKLFKKPIIYTTISPTTASCMSCGQQIVATDGLNLERCPVCDSDDIATFSRVIGYTKMISRKNIKIVDGKYEGDHNFWSNSRRRDWSERKRLTGKDYLDEVSK